MGAWFEAPTDRYPHAVLGDALEWGSLVIETEGERLRLDLPQDRVFEDIAPRLVDLDGAPPLEIVVVESDRTHGARLAIFRPRFASVLGGMGRVQRVTATPWIGQRFRWLAPVAAADLNGDGIVELAYVETPHLGKTLRVWQFDGGRLTELATLAGVTNHRIGEAFISGGLRDCGQGPEMVLANADWTRLIGVRFDDGQLVARDLGAIESQVTWEAALSCQLP